MNFLTLLKWQNITNIEKASKMLSGSNSTHRRPNKCISDCVNNEIEFFAGCIRFPDSNRVRQAVREGGGEGKGKRKLVRVVEMWCLNRDTWHCFVLGSITHFCCRFLNLHYPPVVQNVHSGLCLLPHFLLLVSQQSRDSWHHLVVSWCYSPQKAQNSGGVSNV